MEKSFLMLLILVISMALLALANDNKHRSAQVLEITPGAVKRPGLEQGLIPGKKIPVIPP